MVNAYSDDQHPLVTQYYHQLNTGSCTDTFTSSNFSEFANNPPVEITESYFKCFPYSSYALLSSIGIAAGGAKAVLPFMLIVIMPIIYILLQRSGLLTIIEAPYYPIEKEQALKELAEYMLLVRDGKETKLHEHSVVHKLSKELIAAAQQIDDTKASKNITVEPRYSIFDIKRLTSNTSIAPDTKF